MYELIVTTVDGNVAGTAADTSHCREVPSSEESVL